MLHGQNHISRRIIHFRKTVFKRTSYHCRNQFIHICIFRALCHNQISVSKHRYFITNFKNFIHFMRNINQSNSLLFQHSHHFKKFFYFLHRQWRGRLIQNDHLGIIRDCFCNLAHLPLRNRHITHRLRQVDCHSQFSEKFRRLFFHPAFIYYTDRIHRIPSKKQIVNYISLQTLIQFLVNHSDTVFQRLPRSGKTYLFPIQEDISFVFLIGTEKTLHHRWFSSAVFPHKPHNCSRFHIQIDASENSVSSKGLTHIPYR